MKYFVITYCILTGFISLSQTNFDSTWTSTKYDTILTIAESAYDKADFITAHKYFDSAFIIRPTNHSNRYVQITKSLNNQATDPTLSTSMNRYNRVISVAESLYNIGNECDAIPLYHIAKKLSDSKHPDDMLSKIHHPIHCDEEADNLYYKVVKKGDECYFAKDLVKAKLFYERAIEYNQYESYPYEQLKLVIIELSEQKED